MLDSDSERYVGRFWGTFDTFRIDADAFGYLRLFFAGFASFAMFSDIHSFLGALRGCSRVAAPTLLWFIHLFRDLAAQADCPLLPQSSPHAAMVRHCYLCGSPYLGGRNCSRPGCERSRVRLRDIRRAQQEAAAPPPAPAPTGPPPSEAEPEAERDPGVITSTDLRAISRLLLGLLEGWVRHNGRPPNDNILEADVIAAAQVLGFAVFQRGTGSNG